MKNAQGFSLLEVLITLVILAIGLLGLAGLQATGLQQNHSAYMRSQATQFAYDIADRMRANSISVDQYLTSDPSTASQQAGCTSSGCTSNQMAENDLYEWYQVLSKALPSAEAVISRASGIYTVEINWDDNHDGAVDDNDPDFLVSFEL